jgi:cysteine desulfurase
MSKTYCESCQARKETSLYLDYNASTPIDERVLEVMIRSYREFYGNADSRSHDYGTTAKQAVENAREDVAALLGVRKNEVVFTSGATESNNMAILGMADYGMESGKRHIVTTAIEHKAVLDPIKYLESKGFEVDYVIPGESGRINAEEVLKRVRQDTLLVSVLHVNNETGIIQPIGEIGTALADTDTFFHTDAVQSCGKLVDEIRALSYDFLSLTAHKMHGSQGIGALVVRRKKNKKPPIRPIIFGGGHEGGLRAGTLPVALIDGFGKACEIAMGEYQANNEAYKTNKALVLDAIKSAGVAYAVNGEQAHCMDNTLNISFLGVDSEALMIASRQYCSISNGSACTSHDYSHSHVLMAMGLSEDRLESAIRLSWGRNALDRQALDSLLDIVKSQQ